MMMKHEFELDQVMFCMCHAFAESGIWHVGDLREVMMQLSVELTEFANFFQKSTGKV